MMGRVRLGFGEDGKEGKIKIFNLLENCEKTSAKAKSGYTRTKLLESREID